MPSPARRPRLFPTFLVFIAIVALAAASAAVAAGKAYDVYLVAGQSNADGRGFIADLTGELAAYAGVQTNVKLYYVNPTNSDPVNPAHETGWVSLAPGYSIGPGFSGTLPSSRFGFEVSLGKALAAHDPSRHIALIKVSRGSTTLADDWDPSGGANYMWQTFANTIPAALAELSAGGDTATIRGLFWHQGESDGSNPTYQSDLVQFIASVRALTRRPYLPVALGELERDNVTSPVVGRTYQLNAMANIAAADPHSFVVSSAGLLTSDGTHFTSSAYVVLGERFAAALHARPNALPSITANAPAPATLDQFVPWTPAQLATAAWFDAADTATLTVSAGAVSAWADKSGHANHAAQPTSALRPRTDVATLGGRPAVSFRISEGTTKQFLSSAHHASLNFDASGGANIFAVLRHLGFTDNGSTSVNAALAKGPMLVADPSYGIRLGSLQGIGFKAGTDSLSSANSLDTANQPLLVSGTRDDSARTAFLHLNGALVGSATKATAILGDNTHPLYLGRDPASARYANVDFGEILVLGGALSIAERQRIEGYLAHKWSLAAALPADHPHKSAPPGALFARAVLTASVSDAEGDPLTHAWSLVAGPAPVAFDAASSASTTATFSAVGIYTLRLTSSDGIGSVTADLTITVNETPPADAFEVWANAAPGAGPDAFTADANHDGVADGLAWLLGADSPAEHADALLPSLSVNNGAFRTAITSFPPGKRGSAKLKLQYSADLAVWTTVAIPDTSGEQGGIHFVVTSRGELLDIGIEIPSALIVQGDRFFLRVLGELVPTQAP